MNEGNSGPERVIRGEGCDTSVQRVKSSFYSLYAAGEGGGHNNEVIAYDRRTTTSSIIMFPRFDIRGKCALG